MTDSEPRPASPSFQRDYRQAAPPLPQDGFFRPTYRHWLSNGGTDNVWSSSATRDTPLVLREAAKGAPHSDVIATDTPERANDGGQPVTFVNDKSEPVTWRNNAPEHYAASIQIIQRRLLERTDDIRTAARNLAHAFEQQVKELREGNIPNEPVPLAQYKNLLDFLEQMASGLAELADALDRTFTSTADSPASSPEPVLLGKPAEIVRWLQGLTQRWREEIGTNIVSVPIRFGVLLGGIEFLHWLSADSAAAIGALWWTCKDLQGPSARK